MILSEQWRLVRCDDGRLMVATEGDIVCLPDGNHEPDDAWDAKNFTMIAAAPSMFGALLDLQVIAEQNIIDLLADAQEGRQPDAVWKMEMARWQAVVSAFSKAGGRS